MTKSLTNTFGLALFTALFVALFTAISFLPTFALAKEDGEREDNERSEHVMQRIQKSISRHVSRRGHAYAWGHYKGDRDDRDDDDRKERNGRGHATTTPPVVPPPPVATTTPPAIVLTLSGLAVSNVASSSTTVRWTTSGAASSKVYFGTSSPLNLSTALSVSNASLVTNHSIGLTGLTASTTYYLIVESTNTNGTATSSQTSFTTTAPPPTNQITLTSSVVATHNTQSSCWMTIGNNVYNVTPYIPFHPGGVQEIVSLCGMDATAAFGGVGHSSGATALLANYLLGALGQTITI